jgi:hypothetical protein
MPHADAALTPRARLRPARLIVQRGWTCSAAAKMFMVAAKTAKEWADRYRAEGETAMLGVRFDRACRWPCPRWHGAPGARESSPRSPQRNRAANLAISRPAWTAQS